MKKLLFFVAAFATLFTSCSKDVAMEPVEKNALVSFCVNTPNVGTRYGEGTTAQQLYYAVYDTQEGFVAGLSNIENPVEIKGSTTVNLNLVQGRSYEIIFWAQADGAPYDLYWGEDANDPKQAAGLASMTIPATVSLSANNEAYDAFYNYTDIGEITGALSQTVELKRPFAQLNVATADYEQAKTAGVEIVKTGVKVDGVYNTFNLKSGEVPADAIEQTYTLSDMATGTITIDEVGYKHFSMNYLLVGAQSKLVDVELTLSEDNGTKDLVRTYSSVPVQRNYRTNIIGNIISSSAQFKVEIKPGFEQEILPSTTIDKLVLAAQLGGEFTLEEDLTLSQTVVIPEGVVLKLNLNNYSINIATGSAIQNNGTLTVEGNVVTRTSSLGSIISETSYGIRNAGKLTVNGVKINGINNAGELIFNDGIIENTISGRHGIYHSGSALTINNGTFSSTSGNELINATKPNTTTINGGTFTQIGKSYLFGTYNVNIVINGGTFYGYENDNGTNDKMRPGAAIVKGGAFNFDVSDWVAEGYQVMQSGDLYLVVDEKFDAIVTEGTSIKDVLDSGKKTIFLAEGSYNLGGLMNISNYDATIVGSSPEEVTISGALNMDSSSKNFTVENVTFEWDGSNNGLQVPIQLKDTKGLVKFKNCVFSGKDNKPTGNNGFINATSGVEQLIVEGCTFDCCAQRFGIWGHIGTSATTTSKIINNKFIGGAYNGGGFCIEGPMTVQNVEIKGNEITGYFRIVATSDSYTLKNIVIEDNTLSQNLAYATTTNVENVTFKNNKKANGTAWNTPNELFVTE